MENYFHSVTLNDSKCMGCTNCIKSCPTQAIRVRNGKAIIINEKCIDCGECIKICPHHAKNAITDSMDKVMEYPYKVALVAPSFLSQFHDEVSINAILTAIKNMGFDQVSEVAYSAEILGKVINEELNKKGMKRPLISSACPAITRLIQVRFPELIPQLVTLESPMEVEARLVRKQLVERGLKDKEIGIFFLTPCPAKVTSIKKPIAPKGKKSALNGALAINKIYMEVLSNIKSLKKVENLQRASNIGISWARTGGESSFLNNSNYINVDGIQSVTRVLEEIERNKLKDIAFFEGLACRGGCVGGALTIENTFIAKQRINRRAENSKYENDFDPREIKKLYFSGILHHEGPILPRPMPPLDEKIAVAIQKAEEIEKITRRLPGLDCGACGSPGCAALAEDIVKGNALEVDCIFLLREEIQKLSKEMFALSDKVPPVMQNKEKVKEEKNEG
ncbi:4Fe-4S binding protein [Irregularibacter muris]|uniref:4Fe-4S binding protein n=1 Tax=Irregularibacter muris TaxID=1796619 RepID=A0AAE3KZX5_9FIRM|nr:[Fe-Fe] hydrogenase large subunit C-terminal domain-containing protein [Irregularibacter muris]MCR1899880.1 4Fe-4S binding protein [Irregularibacter muris]